MTRSVNKATIIGNLGRDPDVRTTQDGTKVVNLAVATSERWRDQSGEQKERTEWHRVVIYNEYSARFAEQYLRKGHTVYVEGQIKTKKWTDDQGVDKYTTEIVLSRFRGELIVLSGKNDDASSPSGGQQSTGNAPQGGITSGQNKPPLASDNELDDDIPF